MATKTERIPLTQLDGRTLPGFAVPVHEWRRGGTANGKPFFLWDPGHGGDMRNLDVDLETSTVEVKVEVPKPQSFTRVETVVAMRNMTENRDALAAWLKTIWSPRDVWCDGPTVCWRPGDHTYRLPPGHWFVRHDDGGDEQIGHEEFLAEFTAAEGVDPTA